MINHSELAKEILNYSPEFPSSLSHWIQGRPSLACERGRSQTSQLEPPFPPPSALHFRTRWHFLPAILRYNVSSSFLSVAHLLPWGIKHPMNAVKM